MYYTIICTVYIKGSPQAFQEYVHVYTYVHVGAISLYRCAMCLQRPRNLHVHDTYNYLYLSLSKYMYRYITHTSQSPNYLLVALIISGENSGYTVQCLYFAGFKFCKFRSVSDIFSINLLKKVGMASLHYEIIERNFKKQLFVKN